MRRSSLFRRVAPFASAALLSTALLLPLAACNHFGNPEKADSQIAFGADMAKRGLWSEALFRFREAERQDPQNARVQNNLGVALEASGAFDQALEAYRKALQLAPNDRHVRANYARFVEFYQGFKGQKGKGATAAAATSGTSSSGDADKPQGVINVTGSANQPSTPPVGSPAGAPTPPTMIPPPPPVVPPPAVPPPI